MKGLACEGIARYMESLACQTALARLQANTILMLHVYLGIAA